MPGLSLRTKGTIPLVLHPMVWKYLTGGANQSLPLLLALPLAIAIAVVVAVPSPYPYIPAPTLAIPVHPCPYPRLAPVFVAVPASFVAPHPSRLTLSLHVAILPPDMRFK